MSKFAILENNGLVDKIDRTPITRFRKNTTNKGDLNE